jgi:hypothetical protein
MIVIAGPAANFGRLAIHQRDDGMVGDPAALDAVIVDYIP